jgi:hypothetical protein
MATGARNSEAGSENRLADNVNGAMHAHEYIKFVRTTLFQHGCLFGSKLHAAWRQLSNARL